MLNLVYYPISDIDRVLQSIPGGIAKVLFIPVDNVTAINAVSSGTYMVTYIETTTGGFYSCPVPDQQKAYTEEQKEDDGGIYMDITVNAFIPFESLNNHLRLDIMKYYRYILLVKTQSGLTRLVGSLDNPARFSHSYTSGAESGEVSGTAVQFTLKKQDKPPIFKGMIAQPAKNPGNAGTGGLM